MAKNILIYPKPWNNNTSANLFSLLVTFRYFDNLLKGFDRLIF